MLYVDIQCKCIDEINHGKINLLYTNEREILPKYCISRAEITKL